MKKFSKSIRFMSASLLVIIVSQANLFAGTNGNTGSDAGLTGMQIVTAFAVLVLAILVPLVKSSKTVAAK